MERKNTTKWVAAGFVVGAAAGIIAGLLLAPRSGKETRRMLGERFAAVRGAGRRDRSNNGAEQREGALIDMHKD